ncbi:hypothetical protein DAPPUDRAFT_332997 [Daphnia pulex]|uniref:Uncharacterized protein n=1 Tax=Daphnia pulex TaxID=6669 RepID=E9HRJ3_DAPPU|nr:hypothetical protein DAPPUDRAFT_270229 [Daphnia pulex]EFX65622.1 hypothetical protein DAPPUDRAFT_332997 [Daphnia pulex]|eukprot:EFX62546.1 hypothetical protein DAPPUDRAFT_270229 [Daphnia pulex]
MPQKQKSNTQQSKEKWCPSQCHTYVYAKLKLDQPLESDVPTEMTEEDLDVTLIQQQQALSSFIRFDLQYLFPIFTHRFSRNEVRECRM